MRGPQSALSPTLGAPATPAPWQTTHVCWKVAWPLPPLADAGPAPATLVPLAPAAPAASALLLPVLAAPVVGVEDAELALAPALVGAGAGAAAVVLAGGVVPADDAVASALGLGL